jgi:hypothetical protein
MIGTYRASMKTAPKIPYQSFICVRTVSRVRGAKFDTGQGAIQRMRPPHINSGQIARLDKLSRS